MCFSVRIDKDIKKLAARFNALPVKEDFEALMALKDFEQEAGPEEVKKRLGLKRKPQSSVFKTPDEEGVIYPNYFAPVIKAQAGQRLISPMRYRVRPRNSVEEIPAKYNVFNARIDSLEKRKTWSSLFMRNHGVFPFYSFYEWVEDENKSKRLINFRPNNCEMMWAPCLWDSWTCPDGRISFSSFALLTDAPPPEVEEKGHDRCPIFLKEELLNEWLTPRGKTTKDMYEILKEKEKTFFNSDFQ